MRSLVLALALSATCVVPRSLVAADTNIDAQLTELRQRIDALEAENKAMRAATSEPASTSTGPALKTEPQLEEKATDSYVSPKFDELEAELQACPFPQTSKPDRSMSGTWNNGLEFTSKNKEFRVHVGGRYQFDSGWFDADTSVQSTLNPPYQDGVDFRRARIRIDGTMYYTIDWAMEYDFVNSFNDSGTARPMIGLTDFWWTFKETPIVGNVRIGQQKPPIGFEHLVSSRYLPFMERSYNQDSFYGVAHNGFLPGISCFDNWDEGFGTWHIGLYKPTDNVFAAIAESGEAMGVARITRLLHYDCDGAELLHIGGSVMSQSPVNDRLTFRTRDAIRTGLSVNWPTPANTGTIAGDDLQMINSELVVVNGPWTFQSEYLVSYLQNAADIIGGVVQPSTGTATYHGGYAQVLFFLTGEHDNYNKATGVFDRVVPSRNFYFRNGCVESGPGAWQLGLRYNYLDLDHETLSGGILHNVTCGLNWFLNPKLKIQFDYMATHRDAPLAGTLGDGWIHGVGTRVACDF
jgi:phosphate-selective porin OprO/OprP